MNYLVKKYKNDENFRIFLKILFILLMSRLFMLVLMAIYNVYCNTDRSISFLMNQWDAKRYQFMIDNGYTFPLDTDPQANWAFFPMYVLVCMFFKFISFGVIDTYWVGMLVSNMCIFIAAFVAVKYMAVIRGGRAENYMLLPVLMMWAPYSFYFASVYTEAMFVMFITLFFYMCAKKRYILAGVMAALASATRIVGCLLVFALIVELFMDITENELNKEQKSSLWRSIKNFVVVMIKSPKKILSVMLCPLGAFSYMAFLRFFCGDVWAYKNVQIAWREDEFFPVIGVMWKACTGQIEPRYTYMGWFCVAMFILYAYMIKRKYYSLSLFGIIALLVPLSSHVMSTCRFTVGSFAAFVGVYELLTVPVEKNKTIVKVLRGVVVIGFIVAETVLLFRWYDSDCWLM